MYLFFTVVNMFLLILTYCQLAQTNSLLASLVTIMMLRYNVCDDKCECVDSEEDSDEEDESEDTEDEDEISEDTDGEEEKQEGNEIYDFHCDKCQLMCLRNDKCQNDDGYFVSDNECATETKNDNEENDNETNTKTTNEENENKSLDGLIKSTLQDIMSGGKKNMFDEKGQLREDLIGSVFSRITAFSQANPDVMEETGELALNDLASKGLSYVNSLSALMEVLPASTYYTATQVQQVKERLDDMKTTMCDVIDTGDYTNLEQVLEESTRTLSTIVEENDLLVRHKV